MNHPGAEFSLTAPLNDCPHDFDYWDEQDVCVCVKCGVVRSPGPKGTVR